MNPYRTTLVTLIWMVPWALFAAGSPSDDQIAHSLHEAFKRDIRLKRAQIEAVVRSGSVTLQGKVVSFLDKLQAEQITKRTAGVRSVTNLIRVDATFRRDNELASDVRRRLSQSSFIRPSERNVRVADGVVTLIGQVETLAQSRQAERVAGEVRGVRQVHNRLTTAASPGVSGERSDSQIKSDVEAELARDAYLAEAPIEVFVENGVVRLEGEAPNLYQAERAEEVCRVSGVRAIDNRLSVVSQLMLKSLPGPATNEELREAVSLELEADPRVPTDGIEVAASDGIVTLRGTVSTMLEKQMAERIANHVFAVARVENQLEVDAGARRDEEIRDDILFNLKSDSLLSDQPIEVAVQDGAVTLSGEVSALRSKLHAGRLAARVRGVRAIANELSVASATTVADDAIKQLIVSRLASNATTRSVADRIQVDVQDGIVALRGQVDRPVERASAERVAKFTYGVRSINNEIVVKRGP